MNNFLPPHWLYQSPSHIVAAQLGQSLGMVGAGMWQPMMMTSLFPSFPPPPPLQSHWTSSAAPFIRSSTSPQSHVNQEPSVFECPICFRDFSEKLRPKSGRCGHSVCSSCVVRLNEAKDCPICRKANSFHKPSRNFLAEELIKAWREEKSKKDKDNGKPGSGQRHNEDPQPKYKLHDIT